MDDGPWLISDIPNSSAAMLRCKHQARNGHAKGEKKQSHPADNSANDDCSIGHFGETCPKKQSLESIGCGTQVSIQIPAQPNHFFRYGYLVTPASRPRVARLPPNASKYVRAWVRRRLNARRGGGSSGNVGTAALGCPAGRSPAMLRSAKPVEPCSAGQPRAGLSPHGNSLWLFILPATEGKFIAV